MSIFIDPFRVNFSPADLDNLEYWYDAADTDTIVGASAVSQWKDKSQNQYHLSQAVGANQPVTNSRKINTLNAIDFNGSAHFLRNAGAAPADVRSAFMVFHNDVNIDETTSAKIVISTASGSFSIGDGFGSATGALVNEVLAIFDEDQSGVYTDRQGISNVNLPDITVADHMYALVRQASGSGDWFMGFDGSGDLRNLTNGTRRDWGFSTYGTGLTIGAGGRKGSPVEFFWNGLIAEIIMFSDELTTAERQAVEAYLAEKWAI